MLTFNSLLERNALLHGGDVAILQQGGALTWAEFAHRVATVAGGLAALGIRRGDRFAIISRNSPLVFELLHAGAWLGAVPVPINHRLAPPEIAAILKHADARWVVVEAPFMSAFDAPNLAQWRACLIGLEAAAPGLACSYGQLLACGQPLDPADPQEDETALLLYTGGTTGQSKGVPLTHRNILANALQVSCTVHFDDADVYLHAAPMFHSADLLGTGVSLNGGAHAFLPQFTPDSFMAAVEATRATRTMLAPAMVAAILDSPTACSRDVSSLRQIFYGSSPMPRDLLVRAIRQFDGVELAQGYGLTETSPLLTVLTMRDHLDALGQPGAPRLQSAGRALPGVDILIADAARRAVPVGEPGEVWVRGPNVASGYHAPAGDENSAFRDGWFRTGDIGRLDGQGFLTLLDRSKDMVITGGENVYSIEVEAVLQQHPAVKEAVVIGVPDARYGEALVAVVVCQPGAALDEASVVAHCRGQIGGYKIPRRLHLVAELPKSALGKVLKAELRRKLGAAPPGVSIKP